MAGNIQNLSLAQLNEKLELYRQTINEIGKDFYLADSAIRDMRSYWTGKRMNAILEKYNAERQKLNQSWDFFIRVVVNTLDEIYAQYSSMENEGVAQDFTLGRVEKIDFSTGEELTPTENVKFVQETVTILSGRINEHYDNLALKSKELVGLLDELSSYSDSLNKLVTAYNSHAEAMVASCQSLKDVMTKEINDAIKVVQTTEGYNDADASRLTVEE